MKKILSLGMITVLTVSMLGCGSSPAAGTPNDAFSLGRDYVEEPAPEAEPDEEVKSATQELVFNDVSETPSNSVKDKPGKDLSESEVSEILQTNVPNSDTAKKANKVTEMPKDAKDLDSGIGQGSKNNGISKNVTIVKGGDGKDYLLYTAAYAGEYSLFEDIECYKNDTDPKHDHYYSDYDKTPRVVDYQTYVDTWNYYASDNWKGSAVPKYNNENKNYIIYAVLNYNQYTECKVIDVLTMENSIDLYLWEDNPDGTIGNGDGYILAIPTDMPVGTTVNRIQTINECEYAYVSLTEEERRQHDQSNPPLAYKPVIYLYGYKNEEVSVKLDLDGELTCTYPKYDKTNGWVVTAKNDSTLVDKNGQSYTYLYWEGAINTTYDFSAGFCVKGSETGVFLDKKLKELGLTRREANEFITYWLPEMEGNNYNIISFQTKAYTDHAKLNINPKPDKMFRVFMAWYSANDPVDIPEQEFTIPRRDGKILVEWGGTEVTPGDYKSKFNGTSRLAGSANTDAIIDGLTGCTLEEIQIILQTVVLKKQQIAIQQQQAAAQGLAPAAGAVPQASGGHPFTDKNGTSTTFTDAEWEKLVNTWAYVGSRAAAEELIGHHTVAELRKVLGQ